MFRFILVAFALTALALPARAHDGHEPQNWTAPMSIEVMAQRLRAMGYQEVKLVSETETDVFFSVRKGRRAFQVTIGRSLLSPNNLGQIDAAAMVAKQDKGFRPRLPSDVPTKDIPLQK